MSTKEFHISNDLKNRQICATLIQDLGREQNVSQLLVNTAIVYMHNLYEKFSYKELKASYVAITSFYLSSKSEDSARKLGEIVKSMYKLSGRQIDAQFDRVVASVHALESIMLMTVGFPRLDFIHPHNVIIDIIRKYDIPRGFAETAYYICTSMLHLTTLVVRYTTQQLAIASLYVASKWEYVELKDINSRPWFNQFNNTLTLSTLQEISREFLEIYFRTPVKLKLKASTFLKRFNTKIEHQNVHSTTPIVPKVTPKPIVDTFNIEQEKSEPLEDGEIDVALDDKMRNDNSLQSRKLSLHEYYQRKDGPDIKMSPINKGYNYERNVNISSNNSAEKKRKQNDQSSSYAGNKHRKYDNYKDNADNGKGSFYQGRRDRSATPDEYYNSF